MERTVGNNRLIDGEKLDAISLNGNSKINTNSIGSGNISDAELETLDGITGNIQSQLNAVSAGLPNDQEKLIDDVIIQEDGSIITQEGNCYRITNGNLSTLYCLDKISVYLNGQLISQTIISGTKSGDIITYTDGTKVNVITLETNISESIIAYKNKNNIFTKNNAFKGVTIFQGTALSSSDIITTTDNIGIYDGLKGNIQKLSTTGTTLIKFNNMIPHGVYTLFLINTSNHTINFECNKYNGEGESQISLEIHAPNGIKPAVSSTGTYIITVLCGDIAGHIFTTQPTAQFTN